MKVGMCEKCQLIGTHCPKFTSKLTPKSHSGSEEKLMFLGSFALSSSRKLFAFFKLASNKPLN